MKQPEPLPHPKVKIPSVAFPRGSEKSLPFFSVRGGRAPQSGCGVERPASASHTGRTSATTLGGSSVGV